MKVNFRSVEETIKKIEVGDVVITDDKDILLVVDIESFGLFDLKRQDLYWYNTQDEFEKDHEIEEIYQNGEVEIILNTRRN